MTVIGMTTYLEQARWGAWDLQAPLVPHWYVDLLHEAGADVVLLPPAGSTAALDRLDGLVIIGGADVDARLYGAAPDATADAPRESRDASELALYRRARELDMPVLGICRGLQIMAVAHGGALVQHLPDLEGAGVHRVPLPAVRDGDVFVEHRAAFVDGTLGGRIFGSEEITVNSYHHQAVADAGSLTVCARAEDGTIEACEDPDAVFCIGVQWHPEHPDRRQTDRPLLAAFVNSASNYRAATAG